MPWLISIAAVFIVKILTNTVIEPLLQALALAFIVSAPISFVATKYAADQVAAGNRHQLFPAAIGALLLAGIASGIVGLLFFGGIAPDGWLLKSSSILVQIYATMNFVALSFPAIFRKVRGPAVILLCGFGVSLSAAKMGANHIHTTGMIAGFAVGQILLFALLLRLIRYEFSKGDGTLASWEIFHQIRQSPTLAICGLALAIGVWADKLLPFPMAADWQITTLALLSSVPGVAFFFLHFRTDFLPAQQHFTQAVQNGEPLDSIRQIKTKLVHAFHVGFGQLIGAQVIITLILTYYAATIGEIMNFSIPEIAIFRVALIGSFLLVVFIASLSTLLYLNDTKSAAIAALILATLTIVLTCLTLFFVQPWHGFGFVIASGSALLFAVSRVNHRLANLEFSEGFRAD